MTDEHLKLKNQICFPVYAASRLIIRQYQPYLDKLGITYPQYLVLLVLWEQDSLPINDIAQKLILNTNTVTPLLKRMEKQGIIKRSKSEEDQRKVLITLTEKGRKMKEQASPIPFSLVNDLRYSDEMDPQEFEHLLTSLNKLVNSLRGNTDKT